MTSTSDKLFHGQVDTCSSDNMEAKMVSDICSVTTTYFAGMFAGGVIGSKVFTMPALMKIENTETMRMVWKNHWLCGSKYMPRLAMASVLTGSAVGYLDDTDNRWYWLAGTGAMLFLFPFTIFVMVPDMNKLLKDDVIEQRGEEWVRSSIQTWGRRSLVRGIVSSAAFGTYLYALLRRN